MIEAAIETSEHMVDPIASIAVVLLTFLAFGEVKHSEYGSGGGGHDAHGGGHH